MWNTCKSNVIIWCRFKLNKPPWNNCRTGSPSLDIILVSFLICDSFVIFKTPQRYSFKYRLGEWLDVVILSCRRHIGVCLHICLFRAVFTFTKEQYLYSTDLDIRLWTPCNMGMLWLTLNFIFEITAFNVLCQTWIICIHVRIARSRSWH